jgi:hypothetical protein
MCPFSVVTPGGGRVAAISSTRMQIVISPSKGGFIGAFFAHPCSAASVTSNSKGAKSPTWRPTSMPLTHTVASVATASKRSQNRWPWPRLSHQSAGTRTTFASHATPWYPAPSTR